MNADIRSWIVAGALIVAGTVMIAVGAAIEAAEVRAALPATGGALIAGGLASALMRLPFERSRR